MHNRISGIFVALFGIALLFFVIPYQTEAVDYGWLKPATLPSIAAVIITLSGILHAVCPRGRIEFRLSSALRALLFFCIGILGLCMMTINYMMAAPILMLVLMWVIGERRWKWLFTGIALLPACIWFCIDFLLKRPLP
ncbi:tripartite tricarboxylate transporter TctB family protein [Desulfogranum marinum]|uniref:tripartite tricarboxylate transporter TctB family protein n=1 Tax=Desulfogranum marinum TaxID=453220 RepID=UPI0019660C76|nr:tripartite tricarboxylate transporter TctB family protein [Desulfogranum marinum]MBM9513462.1 tripartite tricarboxylate transporter TctB family protein [Desulfogranum marinum]